MIEHTRKFEDIKPDEKVKSCVYLEKGLSFGIKGLLSCCLGTIQSNYLVTTEEIIKGEVSYDLIVQRRKELFLALNGFSDKSAGSCAKCANVKEVLFKDVSFDYNGGERLYSGFNIQHYTACNELCKYCCYAQRNEFMPPQYDILKILDMFKEKGKLRGNNFIDFSGGEPALLNNLDEILTYLAENNLGEIALYSNASIYNQKIYDLLKEDKIILTTSVDTGLKSTYANLRGKDYFERVIENLVKYRNSGTHNLSLKYVVTDLNRTDDDMWSFIFSMMAIKPNTLLICPDFPYGDKQIPKETVEFIAKLWCNCEKFLGITPFDVTGAFGDPKIRKYQIDVAEEIKKYKKEHPYTIGSHAVLMQCCEKKYLVKDLNGKIKKIVKMLPLLLKLVS